MKKKIYISIPDACYNRRETFTNAALGTFLKVSFLSLLLLMASNPIFAQNANEKAKIEVVLTIKGMVLSGDDSTALYGANIVLKGTGVGTITDKEGRFVFPQQLKEGDVLLFSFVGQQTQEYKVPGKAEDSLVIRMKMGYDLAGELSVNEIYAKPSGRHQWWAKVKSLF